MKKILVPTDFSPTADNALQYAVEIAASFKSELYLYHVYALDRFNYDLNYSKAEQPFSKKVEGKMKLTALKFKETFARKGLSVKTVVEQGDIFSLFNSKVTEHNINLIVMGSKGATGLMKVIFGSVAAMAIDMSKVPVLVIPPECSFQSIQHIVLAVDHEDLEVDVIVPLQKIAMVFDAKVTILNVNTGTDQTKLRNHEYALEGVETVFREVPLTNNVNESINEFIGKEGGDLLCMIRREKGFFDKIFKKSITKAQVYNIQVPLLVLPDTQ